MTGTDGGALAPGVEARSDDTSSIGTERAGRTLGSVVVARPARRQFADELRLWILEEADGCTRPGEAGRLQIDGGPYASRLSAWRSARRNRSVRGLVPKQRPAKQPEFNPLSAKGSDVCCCKRITGCSGNTTFSLPRRAILFRRLIRLGYMPS